MASTLLEHTREAHEEVERLERAIVIDFRTEAVTHKERLLQNHRVNRMLDETAKKSKKLVRFTSAKMYRPARKAGSKMTPPRVWVCNPFNPLCRIIDIISPRLPDCRPRPERLPILRRCVSLPRIFRPSRKKTTKTGGAQPCSISLLT
jgi:hypothetical protein